MLKMELDYWGIDENLFKEKAKDKLEIVQTFNVICFKLTSEQV